jgi:hypothetical protein
LLPYASNKQAVANQASATGAQQQETTTAATAAVNPAPETPACMSESIYKRFKADLNLENGDELEKVKKKIKITANFRQIKIYSKTMFVLSHIENRVIN